MDKYRQIVGKLNWFLFLAVAFTLSFSPAVLRIVWVAWLISWFLEFRFLDKKNFSFSKYLVPSLMLLVFFLWQCLSYFWTIDKVTASVVLERQVSFLFLPLIMMFGVNENYDLKKSIFSFIIGTIVISISYINNVVILSNYRNILNSNYFNVLTDLEFEKFLKNFAHYFGFIRHHAFFSNVLIIASIFLLFVYKDIKEKIGKNLTLVLTFAYLAINCYFFIYLVDSRASLLTITLLIFIGVSVYFFSKKRSWIVVLCSSILVVTTFILILSFHPRLNNIRIDRLIKIEQVEDKDDARLKIWSTALRHIDEYLFIGKGVGSSSLFLEQKNIEDNIFSKNFVEKRFHSHNQYIETTIEMGVFALLLFISAFVYQIYISRKPRVKRLGFFIVITFAVKSLFDAMFRWDDVIILLCFIFLILYWLNTNKCQKSDN
ncbi:MAG: O-antigen ligase family protein [Paludibacteraceae bacterium]|nr:O-antigen ligase family protein [Paludibacteraceae bacterium]